jgi:hypothetical protein
MTPAESREQRLVRTLRVLIATVYTLGVAVIAIAQMDIEITDRQYVSYIQRAGSQELTLFVAIVLLPGIWPLYRPRWPQLGVWIMWAVTWTMFAIIFSLGGARGPAVELVAHLVVPWWPPFAIPALLGAMGLLLLVVIPLVRRTHPSPPIPPRSRLPEARLVR